MATWPTSVDDDGTGTTGTIVNDAYMDAVKAYIDGLDQPLVGNWTPVDASGAGLTLAVNLATFCKNGRLINIWCYLSYPTTSNGATAIIGGFPFINSTQVVSFPHCYGIPTLFYFGSGATQAYPVAPTTLVSHTNAALSGSQVVISGAYLTA